MCVCLKLLSNKSQTSRKLRRYFEHNHPTLKSKDISYFKRLQYSVTNSRIDTVNTRINNKKKYKLILQ